MLNYEEACNTLGRMKDGSLRPSRKIGNNTYLKLRDRGVIAVLLHSTDVVRFYPDGCVKLDSGGWKTLTTKDRMNRFSPLSVCSDKGVWYVSGGGGEHGTFTFADGLTYRPETGEFKGVGPDPKETVKLRKQVAKYAKDFVAAFVKGDVPEPSGGDCWCCSMFDRAGVTNNADHIKEHIEESYFVSSLLVNAMEAFGASPAEKMVVWSRWTGEANPFARSEDYFFKHIEKYIKRYCYRQLGLVA